jgi:hypothetical protein
MIWKGLYLSIFLAVVWFGLTQLGQKTEDQHKISQQSSLYTEVQKTLTVRFFATPNPALALAIKPETLGRSSQPNTQYKISYEFRNIGQTPIQFLPIISLKNPKMNDVITINQTEQSPIQLDKGQRKTISWPYLTKNFVGHKFDTVSIELKVRPL